MATEILAVDRSQERVGKETHPRIIIDASYLRGMSKDGAPLRAMCEQGGRIVITDTLFYELCSTANRNQWRASKIKLVECQYAVEVWEHISEMLKVELAENRPYGDPLHPEGTRRFRKMLANDPQYEPDDLGEKVEEANEQREDPSVPKLFQDFAKLSEEPEFKEIAARIKGKLPHDEEVVRISSALINDPKMIRFVVDIARAATENDMAVSLDPKDVNEKWVIWHFSRSLLTVLCDCLRRGESENTLSKPSKRLIKRFNNIKHDLDYLILLAFADSIASCEIKGELFYYRRWMFGDDSKPLIRSYEKEQIVHRLRLMSKVVVRVTEQLDGYICALDLWSQMALKIEDSEKLPASVFISRKTKGNFELFYGSTWKHITELLTGYSATELRAFGGVVFVDTTTLAPLFEPSV